MAFPDSAPSPRAPDILFPSTLVGHAILKDMDYPVILILLQIGWHEGDRDGRIRTPNSAIASRLRKTERSVQQSIARIEALDPPFMTRSVADGNARVIQLQCVPPAAERPEANPTLPVESIDPRTEFHGGTNRISYPPRTEFHTPPPPHPIRDSEEELGGGVGGVRIEFHTSQAFSVQENTKEGIPKTLGELVAWVPSLTGDAELAAKVARKVKLWLPRLREYRFIADKAEAIDWIQDALIRSSDKDDMPSYAQWLLDAWVKAKGRPAPELRSGQEPLPSPEPGAVAVPAGRRLSVEEKRAALLASFSVYREGTNGTAD